MHSADISAHVFNSASRQYHEVWALQFPFLHGLKDIVPPSEAYLYGCINWSLAPAKQQFSIGLSQSFLSKREQQIQTMDWIPFHCAKEACARF